MRCNECKKGFKFPSTATILKRHWSKQHSEKEQPADRIGSHTSPPHTKKSKIEQALVNVVSIPALAIVMLLHPLVRNLFQVLNPHVEMQESFGTMKEMLRVQFNSVRKSIKEEIAKLQNASFNHVRCLVRQQYEARISCNIVAAFKDVLKIHVDTMFLDEPSEEEEDEENEEDELYSMETEILLQYDFYCLIAAISRDLILGQCFPYVFGASPIRCSCSNVHYFFGCAGLYVVPVLYLEMALEQYSSSDPSMLFRRLLLL
uniref:C2H2-type domain-containing protein n=1 Tax=Ditylenchus dipsaci TaxID=166011 RepID=A0A915D5Z4_9BILA